MDRIPQTVYIKPNVKEALESVSERTRISQSNIANRALIAYLDKEINRLDNLEEWEQ